MMVPVVRKAIDSARGAYSPEDYSVLQLMAEVGETDRDNPLAVGAYAFFQMYTGSLGYWTYEGNTPFMGLSNLPFLVSFVRAFEWPEFQTELEAISEGLSRFTNDQLAAYSNFTLESELHAEIDSLTFSETLTKLIQDDASVGFAKFEAASKHLEQTVEFMEFDDGPSLRAWKEQQQPK